MGWEDRLREAAYTPPSGVRLLFDYEETREEFDQKGSPFNFSDADGTYIQPMGVSGRRYPLRVILWGDDYDERSTAFMSALAERGPGILEHPVYGRVDVVPVGSIKRRDDLVREANQAIIEVEFFATIGLVYPSSARDAQDVQLDAANDAQAAQLNDAAGTAITEDPNFLAQYDEALNKVSDSLRSVTSDPNSFDAIEKSINRGINVIISEPLTLAYQTQQLIQQPGRFFDAKIARLEAYDTLFKNLLSIEEVAAPVIAQTAVQLAIGDLFASATTTATAQAAVRTQYASRPEAVAAAESLLILAGTLAEYRDNSFKDIAELPTTSETPATQQTDTGTSWQATQQVIAEAAGALIEQSFALAQERIITIASPRSIIDLTYELYGEVDTKLDELINTNDLSGDEIVEVPRGREIVYYAD